MSDTVKLLLQDVYHRPFFGASTPRLYKRRQVRCLMYFCKFEFEKRTVARNICVHVCVWLCKVTATLHSLKLELWNSIPTIHIIGWLIITIEGNVWRIKILKGYNFLQRNAKNVEFRVEKSLKCLNILFAMHFREKFNKFNVFEKSRWKVEISEFLIANIRMIQLRNVFSEWLNSLKGYVSVGNL